MLVMHHLFLRYLPKFSLELNINENNNNSIRLSNNNISQNNESLQNDNLNFNINPNQFFGVYNQMNFEKNQHLFIHYKNFEPNILGNN